MEEEVGDLQSKTVGINIGVKTCRKKHRLPSQLKGSCEYCQTMCWLLVFLSIAGSPVQIVTHLRDKRKTHLRDQIFIQIEWITTSKISQWF